MTIDRFQKKRFQKKVILGLGFLLGSTAATFASGFMVKLQSGWSAGMANAGSGVIADPMASFINPASMILNNCKYYHAALHTTGVFPHVNFKGKGHFAAGPVVLLNSTKKTGNAADPVAIPSGGIVVKLHDRVRFGVAVTAPFGLDFNYGKNSPTQFYQIFGGMKTVNITPSLAVRVHEMITLGAGFQAQWTQVKLKSRKVLSPQLATGITQVKGDDWAYGWTAGALLELTKQWTLGLSYRSKLEPDLEGHFKVNSPVHLRYKANARVHFPHIINISSRFDISNTWSLYMDVIRTLWNTTKKIDIRVKRPTRIEHDVTPQKWRNTWFISGGLNYQVNTNWSVRGGYGYDKTPTQDSTRIPIVPDANRHWVALGSTYTYNNMDVTLSYGHEFVKKARINLAIPQRGTLVGRIRSHIDLVSLQFNYKM